MAGPQDLGRCGIKEKGDGWVCLANEVKIPPHRRKKEENLGPF